MQLYNKEMKPQTTRLRGQNVVDLENDYIVEELKKKKLIII